MIIIETTRSGSSRDAPTTRRSAGRSSGHAGVLAILFLICTVSSRAADSGGFCSQTADLVFQACGQSAQSDFLIATAKCINVSEQADRTQCLADATKSRDEASQLCKDQLAERQKACKSLGEVRFDPEFDPKDFDADFTKLSHPNPFFPLTIGNKWEYHNGDEVDAVEILNATKLIAGVRCIVARDIVSKNGAASEATDDWYAQARDGNVWYCGEEVKDFETFDGDNPKNPELVNIDGSFKAERDGDRPGVIFQATPTKGQVYLEEFSLANAEDVTEVLTTTYTFGQNQELDQSVPRALAELLCSTGDCVVTKNSSPLEPGIFARKYYARGIGLFLEVEAATKTVSQLVKCNFDPRCAMLPAH